MLAQPALGESSERQRQALKFFKGKETSSLISLLKPDLTRLNFKELVMLSEAYSWKDDYKNQIKVLETASKKLPKKSSLKLALAKAHKNQAQQLAGLPQALKIREDHLNEATKIYKEVVKSNPTGKSFGAFLGFLDELGLYTDMIYIVDMAIDDLGNLPRLMKYKCKAQFETQLYTYAEKTCQEAVESDSKNSESEVYLARIHKVSGESDKSKEKILDTAKRFPSSVQANFYAGKVFFEEGDFKKALEYLDLSIKEGSVDEAFVLKARSLYELDRKQEALTAFIDACKVHKEPRRPLLNDFKNAISKFDKKDPLKKSYVQELYKCKYEYRPARGS